MRHHDRPFLEMIWHILHSSWGITLDLWISKPWVLEHIMNFTKITHPYFRLRHCFATLGSLFFSGRPKNSHGNGAPFHPRCPFCRGAARELPMNQRWNQRWNQWSRRGIMWRLGFAELFVTAVFCWMMAVVYCFFINKTGAKWSWMSSLIGFGDIKLIQWIIDKIILEH